MVAVLSILSGVFLFIGLVINERNAPYLLSGYNTLSDKEKAQFELIPFLHFFKQSHLFLAISTFFVGLYLYWKFPGDAPFYWLVFYPLFFYMYILWVGQKFYSKGKQKPLAYYIGMVVLILTVLGIGGGMYYANQPNTMRIEMDRIDISGVYGGTLIRSKTRTILVDSLPQLRRRVNGIATHQLKKGYFLTATRKKIKLLKDGEQGSFILFQQQGDAPLYYFIPENIEREVIQSLKKKHWLQ